MPHRLAVHINTDACNQQQLAGPRTHAGRANIACLTITCCVYMVGLQADGIGICQFKLQQLVQDLHAYMSKHDNLAQLKQSAICYAMMAAQQQPHWMWWCEGKARLCSQTRI